MNPSLGRLLFIAAVVLVAIGMFNMMVGAITSGRAALSILGVLAASPLVIGATWLLVQQGQPGVSSFTLKNISYAASAGDLLVLPIVVWLAATAWNRYGDQVPAFFKSDYWFAISLVAGFAIGTFAHLSGGRSNSNSLVLSEQLHDSATSWAHNLGVFPAIAGTLIYVLVPLLFVRDALLMAIIATCVLFVGWGSLVVIDNMRANLDPSNAWHFNPQWLDVRMDWARWRARG